VYGELVIRRLPAHHASSAEGNAKILMSTGPTFTAGPLWRVRFVVAAEAAARALEALEEQALSVSAFEHDGDGGDPAPRWTVELLLEAEPAAEGLQDRMAEACGVGTGSLADLEVTPVAEADWVAMTARQHPPVLAGRFIVHGSHARDSLPPGLLPIEIDAGLAFGSGEHATTQGCLLTLGSVAGGRRPRQVLDMGTGSAVLAIGAARLWPTARILAIDNDPIAVRVAAENVRVNRVDARVRCLVGDGYGGLEVRRRGPYDVILANILADPLIEMAGDLARLLRRGGDAILSGLLDRQADAVIAAHRRRGMRLLRRRDIGPWTTLMLRR
jgi:ribosomal protein L11 methyltransferase